MTVLRIGRLDAARRQLQCAIELWFAGGDEVSAHSLACSAYQVIHDLNRKAKGEPLMFDSPVIKKEFSKEAVASLKAHMNFFKHADLRRGSMVDAIDFDPSLTELFFLASVLGLKSLGQQHTDHESAFLGWRMLNGVGSLGKHGGDVLGQVFDAHELEEARRIEKDEFLNYFLAFRRTHGH